MARTGRPPGPQPPGGARARRHDGGASGDPLHAQSRPHRRTGGAGARRPATRASRSYPRRDCGVELAPVHASVFGSAARGDGDAASDIDVFVVRPATVAEDDATWRGQLDSLADDITRWTGNHAGISEVGPDDPGALDSPIAGELQARLGDARRPRSPYGCERDPVTRRAASRPGPNPARRSRRASGSRTLGSFSSSRSWTRSQSPRRSACPPRTPYSLASQPRMRRAVARSENGRAGKTIGTRSRS